MTIRTLKQSGKYTRYYCPNCGSLDLARVWLGSSTGDGAHCYTCGRIYYPAQDEPIENKLLDHFPAYEELEINQE